MLPPLVGLICRVLHVCLLQYDKPECLNAPELRVACASAAELLLLLFRSMSLKALTDTLTQQHESLMPLLGRGISAQYSSIVVPFLEAVGTIAEKSQAGLMLNILYFTGYIIHCS